MKNGNKVYKLINYGSNVEDRVISQNDDGILGNREEETLGRVFLYKGVLSPVEHSARFFIFNQLKINSVQRVYQLEGQNLIFATP